MSETIILSRKPFAPLVIRRGGLLIYRLPDESGFASSAYEFPISQEHYRVLRDDEERYYFLISALHHPFQLTKTRLPLAEVRRYFDLILLGDKVEVEAFLMESDQRSNGALSNLARNFLGRNIADIRAGRWFR